MSVLNSANKICESTHGDYSASGYVVCVDGALDKAAIGNVSHCSCYGTWEYSSGEPDGCTEVWSGTVSELIELARNNADPAMPSRPINDQDYDAGDLKACYLEVLEWHEKRLLGYP